ncbi:MAG: thioredoxin reductase [Thermoleophilaceae bacterium]|jgi:thioredoxin reductase (NADPH)|nr:thioredoxin reductase [Thermoleophilaceae bacterium]
MSEIENVIIIGSGPAGYTAALYTSRADLSPLMYEGFLWGGLLQTTTDVENYPGFPEGIMGPAMMQHFRDQAERFGARMVTEDVSRVELSTDGGPHRVFVGDEEHRARTVILAMGAQHKKLGVPGEDELANRGVSYCATCDAAFFREKKIMVVGGGDSAMEEAIFLSKFGTSVAVVHRRGEFRASQIMVDRAREIDNIEFLTPYVIERFEAGDEGSLSRAVLKHVDTGEERVVPVDGAFIAIGHQPQSELVAGQVDVDEDGYVITEGKSTRTNVPGVFAAGDLVDHTYRQAVTAAGTGCQAALDAEWHLRDTPIDEASFAEEHWAKDPDAIEAAAERAAEQAAAK